MIKFYIFLNIFSWFKIFHNILDEKNKYEIFAFSFLKSTNILIRKYKNQKDE